MKSKSVKSLNPCQSLPTLKLRQASVIQTSYDIVKAHGGELKVESTVGEKTELIISLATKAMQS